MRRLISLLILPILSLVPALAHAQTVSLTADPPALTLTGTLGNGPLAASLRLTASESLSGVHLFASDLTDATGDGRVRDPLPSSAVTLLPAARFDELPAGALTQVVVQVVSPATAGTYTGTLTVRWEVPAPGELIIPLTVVARTRPVLALQDPGQVVVGGVQGQRISRRVTLRETVGGSPLTGLRALPQDLTTADGQVVLSATRVGVDLPADQIEGGGLLTTTLEVDLRGVPAGAYSGQVLFTADSGNLLALPVMVNVQHGPFLPGLVLVFGVVLGLGLSAYRARGKPRDELVLRIVTIRQAMEDDADLAKDFGPRLNSTLNEAETALRQAQWEEAKAAIARAEKMVIKWRSAREAWMAQLTYLRDELLPRLEGDAWTLRKLRQQAEDAQTGAADFETPAALRDRLFEIEKTLARFEALKMKLEEIGGIRTTASVSDELKEAWRIKELALYKRLQALLPDDDNGWKQLEADVQALAEEMITKIQAAPEAKGAARGIDEALIRLTSALQPLLPAGLLLPDARPISVEAGSAASRRLGAFTLITYAVGGLILAGAGFSTLYLAQPTFGAQPVADYLSLLAWGLGAQTTFAAVADLLRGWDVPFGRRETVG